jgi:outer membrane protein assembly factor BamD (BamD/ComL family)
MFYLPNRWKLMLACSLLALGLPTASAAQAQEAGVKWRTDYHAARKEAEIKKLPLLIDFWRPACPPCEKMDYYTFRDPRILSTLNGKFIPLKINGLEDTQLAGHLQINSFPTIVLATPDGRIACDPLVGFKEADVLHEHLQRLITSLKPSDAMKRDYDNALKWEAGGEYPRAIAALRDILDGEKGRPLQKNAQELLQKIEKRAENQLARAKELRDNGQAAEALEILTDMVRQYPGLQVSKNASDMIGKLVQDNAQLKTAQRNKRALELLTQARDFYKSKDYIPCLDRCEILLANYGDLPEGQQAFALAAEIKNNPEWLQNAADVMTDRLGGLYLALADSYLKRGEVRRAEFYLKRVVQAFPGSRLAESAQIRLNQLQGTTPLRTDVQSARP